jgi:hypothetical protein
MTDITKLSYSEFSDSLIARNASDVDYESWGYVVAYNGEQAGIARFSHCSCYGTYESLLGRKKAAGICWDWVGSLEELLKMARYKLDPHWTLGKSRKADPADSDYCYLMACYKEILKWNKTNQK